MNPISLLAVPLLGFAATAFATDYVADIRVTATNDDFLTFPLDENLEIHETRMDPIRYPTAFDSENGEPVEYDESKVGFSLELWDFARDGETVSFKCDLETRELDDWIEYPEMPSLRWPQIRAWRIWSTPEAAPFTGKLGEWIQFGCSANVPSSSPALRIRETASLPEETEKEPATASPQESPEQP